MLLAGNEHAQAVVRVVAIDDDGQVHFVQVDHEAPEARAVLDAAAS
jgi:hypothetical protein